VEPLSPASSGGLHEEGGQVERLPDGAFEFGRPDGWTLPDVPRPPAAPVDPAGAIRAQNAAQGFRIHARTGLAQWLGDRLDVGWAIDVLHPRAHMAGPTTPNLT
jgi:hypothetical protein